MIGSINLSKHSSQSYDDLNTIIDDASNLLFYIEDIMNHSSTLAPIIGNALLYYAIYPLLISSICSASNKIMGTNTGLFALTQFCNIITYRPIIEAIALILFLPNQPKEIIELVEKYPTSVPQYSSNWISFENLRPTTLKECNFYLLYIRCASPFKFRY